MNIADTQYLATLTRLILDGEHREGRNGGVYTMFGHSMRFDLSEGFPMLTTKRLHWKSIACELIWMLRGYTNVCWLQERGVRIWDEWADEEGELGPIYGAQWRAFGASQGYAGIENGWDQLRETIDGIKTDPFSRRHVVSLWNPVEVEWQALPPCHGIAIQFDVSADGKLSCAMYQRSADWFLGVPFNIASYALLTHLVARETGYEPGTLYMTFGNYHLYANHVEAAKQQIKRIPRDLPQLVWHEKAGDIYSIEPDDFALEGYNPWPKIEAEVSV